MFEKDRYYLRTHPCPDYPSIEGVAVYMRSFDANEIKFSFTDDCKPLDQVCSISSKWADNGWYDVTDLVLQANMTIPPKYSKCVFDSNVALAYRNYADIDVKPLDDSSAVGRLCVIGNFDGHKLSFSKQAYFIAGIDNNGFIIAYSGFCQPLEEWQKPKIQQKFLRLVGAPRKLFLADNIVETCNGLYAADVAALEQYKVKIEDSVAATSTESSIGRSVQSGLHDLSLEE